MYPNTPKKGRPELYLTRDIVLAFLALTNRLGPSTDIYSGAVEVVQVEARLFVTYGELLRWVL
jgi:hypothetical protein